MSCYKISDSTKENNGQQSVQAISPHKKKINPSNETKSFDDVLSVQNNKDQDTPSKKVSGFFMLQLSVL